MAVYYDCLVVAVMIVLSIMLCSVRRLEEQVRSYQIREMDRMMVGGGGNEDEGSSSDHEEIDE